MQADPQRTGIPHVDALIEIHQVEQSKVDAIIERNIAEDALARPRRDELVAREACARRRLAAARGLVTKAAKTGDAQKIATAEARLQAVAAEYDRVSHDCLEELFALNRAALDRTGALFAQIGPAWDTGAAVIEALA